MSSPWAPTWTVRWFNAWERVLDDALSGLPEHPQWRNALLRIMFEARGRVPKKLALIEDRDTPIALVGLRKRDLDSWEPLTNYIVPGFLIVGKQELTPNVLAGLPINLQLAWWRMPMPPPSPSLRTIRAFERLPTHILPLTEDPELYWRESGFLDTARRATRKSAHFRFAVNPPGGLQWTLRNWEAKWRGDAGYPRVDVGDRLAADEFLQQRGQHVTLALLDGEKLIAAEGCVVDGGDLVPLMTYRLPEYDPYWVGHALALRAIDWAKREGFQRYDIGGGDFSYKLRFAPAKGEKIRIHTCPEIRYRLNQAKGYARTWRTAVLRRGFGRSVLRRVRSAVFAAFRKP